METPRRSVPFILLALVVLLVGTTSAALAQTPDVKNVKIKNFGQMDDRFFRGAQPKQEDYKQLAALGIHTIIDLTDDPKAYEKPDAEAAGMQYINIPMSDTKYPDSAKIERFLKLVDDPTTGKFYVHCAGGRHRTGVMGAVYRFNHYNWNYDQVYAEMKNYDFYTRWGHGEMKKFVEDYAVSFQQKNTAATAASQVTAPPAIIKK
ncbi:MAG TPA: tyrosine-protein phosphatase [Pyrinomonadaceae bacterium]